MDRNLARSAGCEWQSWEGNLKRQRDFFFVRRKCRTILALGESFIKRWISVFVWPSCLTDIKIHFWGRGRDQEGQGARARLCVCVHAWMRWDSMRSGSLTVRPSADRDLESVCSRSRDISACGVSAVWVWDMCARLRASAIWVLLAGL